MRKGIVCIAILVLLSGVLLLMKERSDVVIRENTLQETAKKFRVEEIYHADTGVSAVEPYADLKEYLLSLNAQRERCGQEEMQRIYEEPEVDLLAFGFASDVFGTVTIPKMEVDMPVYLGAGEENLMKGACIMTGSSYPIGEDTQNCVLAGHRGWDGAGYFVNIDRMEPGDLVILETVWEVRTYTVREIRIIERDDYRSIEIQKGEDLLTLLSCHPYRSGGLQRILVICEYEKSEGKGTLGELD